jgi:phage terminase Nu1 subunit (DNA packaging protein)
MKYWQLYRDMYPVVAQRGAGDLPLQYGEQFVRYYEKHIADFRRDERVDDEVLEATVVIE